MRYLILDIETGSIQNAGDYIEPATAPSNYVDKDKIAAYVQKAEAVELSKAALDPDLARVVALGCCDAATGAIDVKLAKDEQEEAVLLSDLWRNIRNLHEMNTMLVGYNILGFDLPVLFRRSIYLNVKAPNIQIDRFKHPSVIDLQSILSYDGKMKWRSLSFYASRFGLTHDGSITGAEIPGLVAAGEWEKVASHVRADVGTTTALARRMGVVGAFQAEAVA